MEILDLYLDRRIAEKVDLYTQVVPNILKILLITKSILKLSVLKFWFNLIQTHIKNPVPQLHLSHFKCCALIELLTTGQHSSKISVVSESESASQPVVSDSLTPHRL